MFELIQKAGPVIYPIFLCSITAFAIILERLYYLRKVRIDAVAFMSNIEAAIKRNKIAEAVKICEDTKSPIAAIVKAGILKHNRPRQEMREAIEDAGHQEVPYLEKNIKILATIAQISPLLGLLGTVVGMAKSFQVIQAKAIAFNPVSSGDLAGGIWEALLATGAGLIVAIPVIASYHYLTAKVQGIVLEMERSATELINIMSQRVEGY